MEGLNVKPATQQRGQHRVSRVSVCAGGRLASMEEGLTWEVLLNT